MVYEKDGKIIVAKLNPMSDMPPQYTVLAWYTRKGHPEFDLENEVSYFIDLFKTVNEDGKVVYFSEQEIDNIPLEQLSGWIDLHYEDSSLYNLQK